MRTALILLLLTVALTAACLAFFAFIQYPRLGLFCQYKNASDYCRCQGMEAKPCPQDDATCTYGNGTRCENSTTICPIITGYQDIIMNRQCFAKEGT